MRWKARLWLWAMALVCLLAASCSGHDETSEHRTPLSMQMLGKDGRLPMLPLPLSEQEREQLRKQFDWKKSQKLPETNKQGQPALYYFVVQVQNRDEAPALDLAKFSWSYFPLFESELDPQSPKDGVLAPDSDGEGAFAFVIAPGLSFNLVREHALKGEAIFSVMQPRAVPAEAAVKGGHPSEVSYVYLAKSGFELPTYDDEQQAGKSAKASAGTGTVQEPLLGLIIAAIARAIGEAARDTIDFAREVIGEVADFIGIVERHDVTINLTVLNTDADFPAGSIMRSAIGGPTRNAPVSIGGVRVRAESGVSADLGTLSAANSVTLRVVDDAQPRICFQTENAAALVTNNFIAAEVCVTSLVPITGPTTLGLGIADANLNVLAQMSEGRRYFASFGQFTPRKLIVLVGNFANALAVGGAAFAPVFGGFSPGEATLTSLLEGVILATVGSLAPPFAPGAVLFVSLMSVDIVLPMGDDVSRIIPTHELGHAAFALMINAWNPAGFVSVWLQVIGETVIFTGGAPGPGNQAAVVSEAVADYFAGQIAGGVNRFTGAGTFAGAGPGEFFCNGTTPGCLEVNFGGPGAPAGAPNPFNARVAVVASTIHDLYDGGPGANPNNASAWAVAGGALTGAVVPGLGPHAFDEPVAGLGTQFFNGIGAWQLSPLAPVLRLDTFFRGQSAAHILTGTPAATLCATVYGPHDPTGACNGFTAPL